LVDFDSFVRGRFFEIPAKGGLPTDVTF
jgi:hypothetical protein